MNYGGKKNNSYYSIKRISAFLGKFKKLKPPGGLVEKEMKTIISDTIGVSGDSFNVCYKKPNIIISSNISSLKNEIYINKDKLKQSLKEKLGKQNFEEILFK